ncbi:universal stress protein [Variovorax sp. J22R133]|uniref:universal stress protein n=1 Tax=Variovorax brevis TaxID=3053503 RepID=UPI0025778261|nr:universal stress protein [Variovorax sp. J22R133]MDM0116333.1 universal stress protein [Variovorax sp. J22R133]
MYQRILVPVDGSETSNLGLAEAIRLAQMTKGQLRLLYVIDELSFAMSMDAYAGYAGDWLNTLRSNGMRLLEQASATAQKAGVPAETVLHDKFNGKLADSVASEAVQWAADLIVLGTHGRRGIGRFVMGSGAENVLRTAPVPVLLVRTPGAVSVIEAEQAALRVSLPSAALAME